jgi:hypothetical protein
MLPQEPAVGGIVTTYAAANDYCKIFEEEMHSLYLLAFLLTADRDKAERCFVAGLEECVDRIGACSEGPRSWARRSIVQRAIRMVRPAPEEGANEFFVSAGRASSGTSNPFEVIVSLCAFERFVFVMSVLEGKSDEDCQSLLRCSRQEIVMARKAALSLLVAANSGYAQSHEAIHIWPGLLN